jgi:hypothetical protein
VKAVERWDGEKWRKEEKKVNGCGAIEERDREM